MFKQMLGFRHLLCLRQNGIEIQTINRNKDPAIFAGWPEGCCGITGSLLFPVRLLGTRECPLRGWHSPLSDLDNCGYRFH